MLGACQGTRLVCKCKGPENRINMLPPNECPGGDAEFSARSSAFACLLVARGWVDVMHHSLACLAVISRPQFGGWACARLSGEITRDSVSLASSNRRALSCDVGVEAKT